MDDLCSAKKMRLGGLPGRSFPGTCPASRAGQFLRCGNAAPGTEEAVSASCRRFRRKQKTSSPPRGPAFPEKGGAVPPCRPSPHAVARLRAAPGRERAIKPRTSPAAAAPLPAKDRRSRRAGTDGTPQVRQSGARGRISPFLPMAAMLQGTASRHPTTTRRFPCRRRGRAMLTAAMPARGRPAPGRQKSRRRQLHPAQALT